MARTPKPSSHEVIYIDDGPDTSGPVQPHRPTPEIKSEADSDASSSTRVFARSRAHPVIKDANLRKQIAALQRSIHQTHVATDAAETQEQGRQALMDFAAQLGLTHMIQPTDATPSRPRTSRLPEIDDDDEGTLDEKERGRRASYQRQREEIIASGVSESELNQEDSAAVIKLDRVEKKRRERRRADLNAEREDEFLPELEEDDDEDLFVRGDTWATAPRNAGALVDLEALLDEESIFQRNDFQSQSGDFEDEAGPSSSARKARPGRDALKARKQLAIRPDSEFDSLSTRNFNSMNIPYDQLIPERLEFPADIGGSTVQALKALVRNLPEKMQRSARGDVEGIRGAISWCSGQGRNVKPAGKQAGWAFKGFKSGTVLKHFQIIGAGWMIMRECDYEDTDGGILADAMGLGKTIQSLACIMDDRPLMLKKKDPRLTLIIASNALLDQWYEEISTHCQEQIIGKVYRYYGSASKGERKNVLDLTPQHTIVLTSWYEVMESWPNDSPPKPNELTPEVERAWRNDLYNGKCGILHKIRWRRLILDEATHIKNHRSRTSIACWKLNAERRWLLSGTPIMNSLDEIYSYLRFLRVPGLTDFKTWKSVHLMRKPPKPEDELSDEELAERAEEQRQKNCLLKESLQKVMLRRVNTDLCLGHQILPLPAQQNSEECVDLNEFEAKVYRVVEHRMQEMVREMVNSDSLRYNYAHCFVLLLILRQLTAHTLLIERAMRDVLTMEDIQELAVLAEAQLGSEKDLERKDKMIELRRMLHDEQMRKLQEQAAARRSVFPDTGPLTDSLGEEYGRSFDYRKYIKDLVAGPKNNWSRFCAEMKCSKCRMKPELPRVTDCQHIHCTACLHIMQLEAALEDKDRASCANCNYTFTSTRPVAEIMYDDEVEDIPLEPLEEDEFRPRNTAARKRERRKNESWIARDGEGIVPSAKTIAVKMQVVNWISENPDVKIIIYCQFLDVIDVLGRLCESEGWEYRTYHGKTKHFLRAKALSDFKDDPNIRILIGTLRCGGTGLNLASASRVILVDLWWNVATQLQAWGRIYRHGQTSECRMTTFVVRNTIDEDMVTMQKNKKDAIDAVMEGRSLRLRPKDMCRLFGFGRSAPMPDNLHSSDIDSDGDDDAGDPEAEG